VLTALGLSTAVLAIFGFGSGSAQGGPSAAWSPEKEIVRPLAFAHVWTTVEGSCVETRGSANRARGRVTHCSSAAMRHCR